MDDNRLGLQSKETYSHIRNMVIMVQEKVTSAVNATMVQAYWEIGEQIYIACGENDRAAYGKNLLKYLSGELTKEFGRGFDVTNLRKMRQFYLAFPKRDALCLELSWSHYRLLMRIDSEERRSFYQKECVKSKWSVRQLERQINTLYYDRILARQDKNAVANEIWTLEPKPEYTKIIKDSYVLEFLDLKANPHFYEKDLEQALIDQLQKFLLELGRGFCFEARQRIVKELQGNGRLLSRCMAGGSWMLRDAMNDQKDTTKAIKEGG